MVFTIFMTVSCHLLLSFKKENSLYFIIQHTQGGLIRILWYETYIHGFIVPFCHPQSYVREGAEVCFSYHY